MTIEGLHDYPKEPIDPFLDCSLAKTLGKREFVNYGTRETEINNQTIVYFLQERESNQVVETSFGPKKVFERGVVICGYKINPKGLFSRLKRPKIKIVPDEERKTIESKLVKVLKKEPAFVDFWFDIQQKDN